jgi:hypothetical protein
MLHKFHSHGLYLISIFQHIFRLFSFSKDRRPAYFHSKNLQYNIQIRTVEIHARLAYH